METAASRVINKFRGIRPMAHALGYPPSTVQGWQKFGTIPEWRHDPIRQAAKREGIEIPDSLLKASLRKKRKKDA